MLFREKTLLALFLFFCYGSFVYLETKIGNELWEKKTGRHDRYAVIQKLKIGYVNARSKLIIRPQFNEGAPYFKEGLAPVAVGGLWGFIDTRGNRVIPPQFQWAQEFSEGLAAAAQPGPSISLYGYIDKSGHYIVKPQFWDARGFSEGLAGVNFRGKWGYIDGIGQWIVAPRFDNARSFSEGFAPVKMGAKWGLINKKGEIVVQPEFYDVRGVTSGLAAVAQGPHWWGYINPSGQFIVKPSFDFAHPFSEGLAAAGKPFDVGYTDITGTMVISASYFADAKDFSEGLAAVQVNANFGPGRTGKWGYVDKTGKFIIEPKFDWASNFRGGLARVGIGKNDIRRGYVNPKGEIVWDPARWETNQYLTKATLRGLIIPALLYLFLVAAFYEISAYRTMRHATALFREQAAKRNGTLLKVGMRSEPALSFDFQDVKFKVYFIRYVVPYPQNEIYIEAAMVFARPRQISLFIYPDLQRTNSVFRKLPPMIQSGNLPFDRVVKIPKAGNEKYVIAFLTPTIQKRILESKFTDCLLKSETAQNKFILRCNCTPRDSHECSWLIDTAIMFCAQARELEKNKNLA